MMRSTLVLMAPAAIELVRVSSRLAPRWMPSWGSVSRAALWAKGFHQREPAPLPLVPPPAPGRLADADSMALTCARALTRETTRCGSNGSRALSRRFSMGV